MLVKIRVLGLLGVVLAAMGAFAAEDAPDPEKLKALIQQLGAKDYQQRETAQEALKACTRSALPLLQKYVDAEDPEISLRVRQVITFLQEDPSKIPQNCFVVTALRDPSSAADEQAWTGEMDAWHKTVKMGATNTEGKSASSGGFAQSFIPKCKQIQTVELQAYPVGGSWGWLRLDVLADDNGKPGKCVLARCWLRFPKDCGVPHSAFVVFDIPDIEVNPEARYWLVFAEHPDSESPARRAITNSGLSTRNEYKDGAMWRWGSPAFDPNSDAKFRIISECGEAPLIRKANEEEMKTLPDPKAIKLWVVTDGLRGYPSGFGGLPPGFPPGMVE